MSHENLWRVISVRMLILLVSLLLMGTHAPAQTVNGGFQGVVTDSSGAVLPGATVEAKNLGTGLVRQATTSAVGYFAITQLPPGSYTVSVTKAGFETTRQADIQLQVNQDAELKFVLQVGAVTTQVNVTAAASALQTSSATIGQVIGSQQVVDLPLNGRQFTQLVLLTPGASPKETGQQSSFTIPIGGGGLSPSVNGNRGQENNFTLDGILNNAIFTNVWSISPPPDAIQEFNVQSHITDAQFSISSGANINVVTKTGTDQFHGDVWEFIRNNDLDAANFFDNYFNSNKPAFRQNQYGIYLGGPLMIPHLYDGRAKKTYVSGYWEGFRSSEGFTETNNVPSAAELSGNFSDLLTGKPTGNTDPLGRPIMGGQIYNPYSTRQVTAGQVDAATGLTAVSSGLVRDPFNGNQINLALNPQALAYLKAFYPAPNLNVAPNVFPNFATASAQVISNDQFGVKLDHTFGNNNTLYGNFYYTNPNEAQPTSLLLGAGAQQNHARVIALGYTHIFSPTLLGSFHYGYNRSNFGSTNVPGGTALLAATGQTGFEPVRDGIPEVPQVNLSPRLGGTGQFAIPLGPIRSHQISGDIQKIHGSHTFSVGAMYFHVHSFDDGWGSTDTFNQFATSATYGAGLNDSATGDGLASMLLNLPASLFGFVGATYADDTTNWKAFYAQDKWQASKKLSISIGIRYDFVPPATYKNNQVSGWNPECPVPPAGTFTGPNGPANTIQYENACFLIPIPFPTPNPPAPAAPTSPSWPIPNVRKTFFDPKYNGWQPRVGLAYSFNNKTVIRAAFAMFDDHNNTLVQESQDPRIAWPFGAGISIGSLNQGLVNCQSPSLSAFQACFSSPPAASQFLPPISYTPAFAFGAATDLKIPYAMEYNFDIERELARDFTLTTSYVGSQSRHLFIQPMYNAPLPQNMGPGPVGPRSPFPFFGQFPWDTNSGVASYNSLQAKLQKRFSRGLVFLGSYTWSKCLSIQDEGQSGSIQNPYDWSADKGDCDFNIPQIFVFSYAYELPVGKGKTFGSGMTGVSNAILGGWQISGITTVESGAPFTVTANSTDVANISPSSETERANVTGQPVNPSGFKQSVETWYNPAAFVTPPLYTFGNVGRNTLRGPDDRNFDFALLKNFAFKESRQVQFRAETFNILNRANFAPPGGGSSGGFATLGGAAGTSVNGTNFMHIFGAAAAREIQFSLKFLW